MLQGEAFEVLKRDIAENGQQVPIALWKGKILDGRNRLKACLELGIRPRYTELATLPRESPLMYVLSTNLHRRHLRPSQLAMVGARARAYFDVEASARRAKHYDVGRSAQPRGDARDLAGGAVGVSGKSIDFATRVLSKGVSELVRACDSGLMPVSTGAKLAELPAGEQRALLRARKTELGYALKNKDLRRGKPDLPQTLASLKRDTLRAATSARALGRVPIESAASGAGSTQHLQALDEIAAAAQSIIDRVREHSTRIRRPPPAAASEHPPG
jgi:hypothetical protein